jgi:serine/threonine protein phosphatase PrpC
MLDVEFSQLSDPGRVRPRNEDYLGYALPRSPGEARSHGWLFALADGVGGQRQGEVASRAAIEETLGAFRRAAAVASHRELLTNIVQAANARVFDTGALSNSSGSGMASTIVVCALRFDSATVAHVGDSRCYLIRKGEARPLTHDHTVASEQERLGILSAEEAAEVSTRHVLSRSLGTHRFARVDVKQIPILSGDVLLLCSDGLHGAVSTTEIAHTVSRGHDLTAVARDLVAMANQQDGSDNISVQIIRIRSVERIGMYRGRPYRLR